MRRTETYFLPTEDADQLTKLCQWHTLADIHSASLANTNGAESGLVQVLDRAWQTSLKAVHIGLTGSIHRSLQLVSGPDTVKFRGHAFPAYEFGSDQTGPIVAVSLTRGSLPKTDFVDSAPLMSDLKITRKSAGHLAVRSTPVIKDKAAPEVVAIESQESLLSIDNALEVVRSLGSKLLELVDPEAVHSPYIFTPHEYL